MMGKKTDTGASKQASTASKAVAKATAVARTAESAAKTAVAEKTAEASKNVAKAAKIVKETASKAHKTVSPVKKEPQTIHYFEINGDQISTETVTERIKEAHKADGHRLGSVKSLDVYYNFDERRAYYVVNGKAEGKYVEF